EKLAKVDLRAEGFAPDQTKLTRLLAMRYRGQSFELEVAAESDAVTQFHQTHRERYGHADEQKAVEIVSIRLRATGITDKPNLKQEKAFRRYKAKPDREALVWLGDKRRKTSVFDREHLLPGAKITAPAIVVEYGSTTLIPAGWRGSVDAWQNLILESL
ncbi:MAG: hydantoinase/oxoprolinase family protein, partial [Blastocatellia bacterium]